MTKRTMFALGATFVIGVVACAAEDVQATDYDQSCAKDDDCVAIAELHADGTDCTTGCPTHAINKKDEGKYQADFDDSRRRCSSMAAPFCEVVGTPACVRGRCEVTRP